MKIRPFKTPAQMDKNAALNLWNNLESSINQIYLKMNSELSFEILYRYDIFL